MGLWSVDPAKGGAAVARLGAGFLRSAAGQPGQPSSLRWPSTALTPTGSAQWPAPQPKWQPPSPARGSVLASCPILAVSVPCLSTSAAPDPGKGASAPARRSGSIPPFAWPPSGGPPAGDPRRVPVALAPLVSCPRWPPQPPLSRTLPCLAGASLHSGRGWCSPPPRVASPVIAPAHAPSGSQPAPSSGPSPLVAPGHPLASRWWLLPAAVGLGPEFPLASRPPYLRGFPPSLSRVTPPFPLPVAGDRRFPLVGKSCSPIC